MRHHHETPSAVLTHFDVTAGRGLTKESIAVRQAQYGPNAFAEAPRTRLPTRILHHLSNVTALILIAAALISLWAAIQFGEDFTDPIVIGIIIIVDIVLALKQEMSAEKALESLKNFNAHTTAVIRDGQTLEIDATELVPGDIITVSAGDMVPADARIIRAVGLTAEESILTGESAPSHKIADAPIAENAPVGDRSTMLFSGCLVTSGNATAVVTATGMDTEMGAIAGLLNSTKTVKTPLQKRLSRLGAIMSVIALGAAATLFVIEFIRGAHTLEILVNAVALAVAAVPEVLPVTVTVTLAFGVIAMARKQAIIRRIPAVETLGSASVICSDKTGTLTMNQMTITRVWPVGRQAENVTDPAAALSEDAAWLVSLMALASNARVEEHDGVVNEIGDPTETAIARLLHTKQINFLDLNSAYPRVHEVPFDSDRKLMTTVHRTPDGRYLSITKGAFDRIPARMATDATDAHDDFARDALRMIACGYAYHDTLPMTADGAIDTTHPSLGAATLEHDLTFAGFVGMVDPPRPESAEAVARAKAAGIRTIMITGDHSETATAIAADIGIHEDGDRTLTGAQLADLSEDDLATIITDVSVYARVSPEDKIRIVSAWQKHGAVVAMTGDGVNDAPALKAADVGVAMGSGTDVSKNAGDIVLTDDNFSSIVDAVSEGRRVYSNIRKVLYSLVSCNFSEIILILAAVMAGWGVPIVAIQLLMINVVADGIPVLFIYKEKDPHSMSRTPVPTGASIFAGGLGKRIAGMSIALAAVGLAGFAIGNYGLIPGGSSPSYDAAKTMAYVIVAWSSALNVLSIRTERESIFRVGFGTNPWLLGGVVASIGLVALTAVVPPLMGIFYTVPLSAAQWVVTIVLAIVPLALTEGVKWCARIGSRDAKTQAGQEVSDRLANLWPLGRTGQA